MIRWKRLLLQLLLFLGFFPYPAVVNIGNTLGIQMSDVLVVIIVVLTLPMILQARSAQAFAILVLPIVISLGALAFLNEPGDVGLGLRVSIGAAFSLLILPASGSLMRHARLEWLITPVSTAILIHTMVGLWQYRAFAQGTFPLLGIFQNTSFHNLQDISTTYALYVARPFGLFPEPSAMAAALGPWILFLLWYGLRQGARGRTKALVAAAAGTLLILLSQSVYAIFLLPCALVLLILHRRTSQRRISVLELLAWIVAGFGSFLFPILSAGRLSFSTNGSAQGRATSLIEGVMLPFNSIGTVLFGVGPGQSANALAAQNNGVAAIYSVVVSVFAEGGFIALVAMICVWLMCLRGRPPGYRYVLLFAWVAGIGFTTSYISLDPIWLFLAMMLDLEFESEGPPRNTNFGIGRSRATPDGPGDSAEQGRSVERPGIHAAQRGTSDGSRSSRRSACSRIQHGRDPWEQGSSAC